MEFVIGSHRLDAPTALHHPNPEGLLAVQTTGICFGQQEGGTGTGTSWASHFFVFYSLSQHYYPSGVYGFLFLLLLFMVII
jgi:hypothetical protein